MKRSAALFSLLVIIAPATARAQHAAPPQGAIALRALRPEALWGPLHFLASDALEGRGTGARGGNLAAQFIASQFMLMGLSPAGDSGTWFHRVAIVTMVPNATLEVAGGGGPALRFRDDFVAWAQNAPPAAPGERSGSTATDTSDAAAEVVFVGFGIAAPEWQWDDYKGVDVRGKILLMLVNDPGLFDSTIFRGRILTYYGRWTYKLEEAARRGAAGVLLVHNDTMATYGWSTVANSWTGDQVSLLAPRTSLAWAGWLTQPTTAALLATKGLDLSQLMNAAARRDFRPVATGLTLRGRVISQVRHSTADNVVARLPGSASALRDEAVLLTAHYDHLGIGQPVNGDSIMNGALDNASGVATMLAIADAFATSGVRARRSLLFVAFTGEEKGLLGSGAFAARSPVPLARIAAILNIDVANLFGRTRDISVLGGEHSSLGATFARAARAENLRVTPDAEAMLRGAYFRSDHFPLARAGVPGLTWEIGDDAVGHPAGWMHEQKESFNRDRYHQPGDEILPWYTVDGALQQARVMMRVALDVGNAAAQPTWNASSEFHAAGAARVGNR
ncbi:MAG: M28 family peptidase [Gemmatimonadales bacterium]